MGKAFMTIGAIVLVIGLLGIPPNRGLAFSLAQFAFWRCAYLPSDRFNQARLQFAPCFPDRYGPLALRRWTRASPAQAELTMRLVRPDNSFKPAPFRGAA
jgi:hypothetical protein